MSDEHERILALVAPDPHALAVELVERYRVEMASYRRYDPDEILDGLPTAVEIAVDALRDRRRLSARDRSWYVAHGARRAHLGVSLEDMVRGYSVAQQAIMRRARSLGRDAGVSEQAILDFADALGELLNEVAIATAEGHRHAEVEHVRHDELVRSAFVRGALFGGFSAAEVRERAASFGLDPARPYVPFRAAAEEDPRTVARALGLRGTSSARDGMAIAIEPSDVAGFLAEAPAADLAPVCGLGPAALLERIEEPFRLASRALRTARAFELTGVRRLEDLGLLPAVLDDREVGERLHDRLVRPVLADASGVSLLDTVEAFIEADLRSVAAAAALNVHANTLRYRLRRFEQLSGADLGRPASVAEVWWALRRHRAVPLHNG